MLLALQTMTTLRSLLEPIPRNGAFPDAVVSVSEQWRAGIFTTLYQVKIPALRRASCWKHACDMTGAPPAGKAVRTIGNGDSRSVWCVCRLALLALVAFTLPAAAHPGHVPGDALSGFLHPLTGIDHVAAMVAVGAWSALAGGKRVWLWPLSFIAAMIAGAALAQTGVALPYVEQSIAASLVVIGVLLALAINAPTGSGAALVAVFAIFHGYAHGLEAAGAALLPFMAGFTLATAALHLLGIGIAHSLIAAFNAIPVRLIGATTAAAGILLLIK